MTTTTAKGQRWIVKPITLDDGTKAYYVMDSWLGYATQTPMTNAEALRVARYRNRMEPKSSDR